MVWVLLNGIGIIFATILVVVCTQLMCEILQYFLIITSTPVHVYMYYYWIGRVDSTSILVYYILPWPMMGYFILLWPYRYHTS